MIDKEYCPFPGRDCNSCSFLWLNVCLIADARKVKKDESEDNIDK